MKNKFSFFLFLPLLCCGIWISIFPAYGTKVNLPTVKEVLTVLNIQESLKPTTFVLMSYTSPTESVTFNIQVFPCNKSKRLEASLKHPLIANCRARFCWKTRIIPRTCLLQGDLLLHDPYKGKLLIRVIARLCFPPWHPPTCRLIPECNPTAWEFKK